MEAPPPPPETQPPEHLAQPQQAEEEPPELQRERSVTWGAGACGQSARGPAGTCSGPGSQPGRQGCRRHSPGAPAPPPRPTWKPQASFNSAPFPTKKAPPPTSSPNVSWGFFQQNSSWSSEEGRGQDSWWGRGLGAGLARGDSEHQGSGGLQSVPTHPLPSRILLQNPGRRRGWSEEGNTRVSFLTGISFMSSFTAPCESRRVLAWAPQHPSQSSAEPQLRASANPSPVAGGELRPLLQAPPRPARGSPGSPRVHTQTVSRCGASGTRLTPSVPRFPNLENGITR